MVAITGAAGGVGALLVERFLANGDTVLATDLSSDALERLRGGTGDDAKLITAAADISKEVDCERLADLAREEKAGRDEVLRHLVAPHLLPRLARRRLHPGADHQRRRREVHALNP